MSVPRLSGPRVTLRPPVDADIAARRALGTDPGIHRLFGGNADEIKPYSDEMAAGWLRLMREHPHAWVIEAEGRMIGELRLDDVDMRDRRGTLALGILDPAALGLGYGTEAVRLIIAHAFGQMGLHRIGLRVLAYNERAIRCYQRCGFVIEGREREAALVDGEFHDDIMMGILSSDSAEQIT